MNIFHIINFRIFPTKEPKLAELLTARSVPPEVAGSDLPKTKNSNLYRVELHRPSFKGTKLLFHVIKAIIIICIGAHKLQSYALKQDPPSSRFLIQIFSILEDFPVDRLVKANVKCNEECFQTAGLL